MVYVKFSWVGAGILGRSCLYDLLFDEPSPTTTCECKIPQEAWPEKHVKYSFLVLLIALFMSGFLKSRELSWTQGPKSIFFLAMHIKQRGTSCGILLPQDHH